MPQLEALDVPSSPDSQPPTSSNLKNHTHIHRRHTHTMLRHMRQKCLTSVFFLSLLKLWITNLSIWSLLEMIRHEITRARARAHRFASVCVFFVFFTETEQSHQQILASVKRRKLHSAQHCPLLLNWRTSEKPNQRRDLVSTGWNWFTTNK